MDKQEAASLLREWIPFTGMDDPEGWIIPGEEEQVTETVRVTKWAFEYAIDILEEGSSLKIIDHEEAIDLISEWPEFNGMDDAEAWEKEDYPFVRNCLKAIEFTVDVLKKMS